MEWESLVPKMDIWLDVERDEIHYVANIIPTLKWRGGKLGTRLAFLPKDISKLFADYREEYFADIKSWLVESVQKEIEELQRKKTKKTGSKAGEKREEKIKKKMDRLAKIRTVQKFSYNPNGDNVGYDSLSHSEVIKMSTEFIATEPTMQDILTSKYPIYGHSG